MPVQDGLQTSDPVGGAARSGFERATRQRRASLAGLGFRDSSGVPKSIPGREGVQGSQSPAREPPGLPIMARRLKARPQTEDYESGRFRMGVA